MYNVNNYENNNSVRYDLCSTDDKQALSIGEEGVLCWAARGTRNSAVDLRPYIIAPELPIPSLGGADYHLYCIRTDRGDRYAYHMEDATNSISLNLTRRRTCASCGCLSETDRARATAICRAPTTATS